MVDRMEDYSVVGFVEAIGAIPAHYRLLRRTMDAVAAGRYDLAVLVDYPGYHLRLAERIAARGVPVLYYVAPQLWAWGASRVRRMRAVRRVAVILPFEEEFFRSHGIAATFVGIRSSTGHHCRRVRRAADGRPDRPVGLFPGAARWWCGHVGVLRRRRWSGARGRSRWSRGTPWRVS
jgi:lipid-A-disaccharide synthase